MVTLFSFSQAIILTMQSLDTLEWDRGDVLRLYHVIEASPNTSWTQKGDLFNLAARQAQRPTRTCQALSQKWRRLMSPANIDVNNQDLDVSSAAVEYTLF